MGLECGFSYVPSPTPPIRKLRLDSCSSEYDEILRGIGSWLPHPCAMEIISSVPVYRQTGKKRRSEVDKIGTYMKEFRRMLSTCIF